MRYFFYGTLMDPAVLAAVIGRRGPPPLRQAASLDGYRRVYRACAWYPIIVPADGERVEGIVVTGLRQDDARRLDAFEGDEYVVRALPVDTTRGGRVVARVFMARADVPTATARPWSLEDWRRRYRRDYLECVIRTRKPR
jgi:gamma-glutamylcyclotransferase (GGCT)/AIG2-like uncharacterized protein YtfP